MAENSQLMRLVDDVVKTMELLFGECRESGGTYRFTVSDLGAVRGDAVVEMVLEAGLRRDKPYPILCFTTTLYSDLHPAYENVILDKLNELNTAMATGLFPAFGSFGMLKSRRQIYMCYRMPVNAKKPEAAMEDIRYFLAALYDELDLLIDFVYFICEEPGASDVEQFLQYVRQAMRIDDIDSRRDALEKSVKDAAKYFRKLSASGVREDGAGERI